MEKYMITELEITAFDSADVITASDEFPEEVPEGVEFPRVDI